MKLKTRSRYNFWAMSTHRLRRPSMPQFASTCPSGYAADAAVQRSELFRWAKQINRLERKHMKAGVLEQLLGGTHTQHVTND